MDRENMNSCDYTAAPDNTFTLHPADCQCATCASGTTHPAYHEVLLAAGQLVFTNDTGIINRTETSLLFAKDVNDTIDWVDIYPEEDEVHVVGPDDLNGWVYRALKSKAPGDPGDRSTLVVSDHGEQVTVEAPFKAPLTSYYFCLATRD